MTREEIIEAMARAIGRASGWHEKALDYVFWCEPLQSGLLVRREIREDRGEKAPAHWVQRPAWKFRGLDAQAEAALSALCKAAPGLSDVIAGKAVIVPVKPTESMIEARAK